MFFLMMLSVSRTIFRRLEGCLVNNELERTWQEFETIHLYLLRRSEKNHERPHKCWCPPPHDLRTRHLPNISLKHCRLSQLAWGTDTWNGAMKNTNMLQTDEKGVLISPIEENRNVEIRNVYITRLLSIYSEYKMCNFTWIDLLHWINIVTCVGVCVTTIMGSRSDVWICWHFCYSLF
jgi:hypothetical protein